MPSDPFSVHACSSFTTTVSSLHTYRICPVPDNTAWSSQQRVITASVSPVTTGFHQVNCRLLHGELGLISCPLPACEVCPKVADVDAQISKTSRLLLDLGKRRQEIILKMNSRHDDLTRFFPVEIVSRIFIFFRYSAPYDFGVSELFLSGPILLGSVWKRWREVTLGTPELWTDVIIDLKKDPDYLDIAQEWLRRSGSLPLNLELHYNEFYNPEQIRYYSYCLRFEQLLAIVRSPSRRWKNLKVTGPCQFPGLFDNLKDVPDINVLDIRPSFDFDWHLPFNLRVRPKKISSAFFRTGRPLEWDNLTFLDIQLVSVEYFIDIVRVAKRLRICFVAPESSRLPSITPAIHYSLKRLSTYGKFLLYLTLPSLQHLRCMMSNFVTPDALEAFIKRSGAPLQSISLSDINSPISHLFKDLSTITQLSLLFRGEGPDRSTVMDHFLRCMTNNTNSDSITLPNLQSLEITAFSRTANSWSLLANLFPRPNHPPERWQTRPISFLAVSIESAPPYPPSPLRTEDMENLEMDKDTLMHLLQVPQSGVTLELRVLDDSDVLQHMSTFYKLST